MIGNLELMVTKTVDRFENPWKIIGNLRFSIADSRWTESEKL